MTAKDHRKTLGILFAVYAGLSALGIAIGALIYGGLGAAMSQSRRVDDQMMGAIFVVAAIAMIPIGILFMIPTILAAYKLIKDRKGARFWGIFAAILALLSLPLGTALGIYALWFFFSDKGKNETDFYAAPPMPPNNWR